MCLLKHEFTEIYVWGLLILDTLMRSWEEKLYDFKKEYGVGEKDKNKDANLQTIFLSFSCCK